MRAERRQVLNGQDEKGRGRSRRVSVRSWEGRGRRDFVRGGREGGGASQSGEEKVDYDGDDVLLVVIKIVAMRGLKRR